MKKRCLWPFEVYLCPTDPSADWRDAQAGLGSSYAGNFGSGVQRFGYNGMFQNLSPDTLGYSTGPVRDSNVTRGLSETAAVGEILVADAMLHPLRATWWPPTPLLAPSQLDAFAQLCKSLPSTTAGNTWSRGHPWTVGDASFTLYNHVLTPNQKSCYNGTNVQEGAYTAASMHGDGVNVLLADGHLRFIASEIDLDVWRKLGSRFGNAP